MSKSIFERPLTVHVFNARYLMRDFSTGAGACYHDGTRWAGSRVTGKAALVSMVEGVYVHVHQET